MHGNKNYVVYLLISNCMAMNFMGWVTACVSNDESDQAVKIHDVDIFCHYYLVI
jgi:hypothetical protein